MNVNTFLLSTILLTTGLIALATRAPSALAAPPGFADEVMQDGPVGYWRLNEPANAGTAVDSSNNGNNGSYLGAGVSTGRPGLCDGDTAALFDIGATVEGRIRVSNTQVLNPVNITMEAFVRWDGPNTQQQRILEKSFYGPIQPLDGDQENGEAAAQYGLSIDDGGHAQVELRANGNVPAVPSSTTLGQGANTHIVATYDGTMIRIYVNGCLDTVQCACGRGDIQTGSFDLGIGNQAHRNRSFNGMIDEIALYDHALSADRIRAHFQALTCIVSPCVANSSRNVGFQYAARFICGKSTGQAFASGQYFTCISVRNPTDQDISFRKRLSIAPRGKKAVPMSKLTDDLKLGPNETVDIDGDDLLQLIGQSRESFLKGSIVFESKAELDVEAIYTVAGRDEVQTMIIEHVVRRR